MVHAARDLATFRQHGIQAHHISRLAHKCEQYQELLDQPQALGERMRLEKQLRTGLEEIRTTAGRIWGYQSPKYRTYNWNRSS